MEVSAPGRPSHYHDPARHHRRRCAQDVRLKMPPDQHRSTLCDDLTCGLGPNHAPWTDVQWSPDAKTCLRFHFARPQGRTSARSATRSTGEVRESTKNTSPTQFESGHGPCQLALSARVERSSSGLPSVTTGDTSISTTGHRQTEESDHLAARTVTQLLHVDARIAARILVHGGGARAGDPYFRISIASASMANGLIAAHARKRQHMTLAILRGSYFVDSHSTPEIAPVRCFATTSGKFDA